MSAERSKRIVAAAMFLLLFTAISASCQASIVIASKNEASLFTFHFNFNFNLPNSVQKKSPYKMLYNENKFGFSFSAVAAHDFNIDGNTKYEIEIKDSLWTQNYIINFNDTGGFWEDNPDEITLSGNAQHSAGCNEPHIGDDEKGDPFTFPQVKLEGAKNKGKTVTVTFADKNRVSHPRVGHFDKYSEGILEATFDSEGGAAAYSFKLRGVHAIPEPSTFTVFAMGTLMVLAYGWRRQKHSAQLSRR